MVGHVRVGDVLSLQRRSVDIDPLTEYSLIGVYSFGKGIFHREPRRGSELGDYRFFSVEPGDLVLSNIQAWEGAIAHAIELDAGTIGTHRFLTYVSRDERIDTSWAKWFFLSEPGMDLIRKAAPGTTIRNRTLSIDRFEALEIQLPPINEQRRISANLDCVAAVAGEAARLTESASKISAAIGVSLATRPDLSDEAKRALGWRKIPLSDAVKASGTSVAVEPGNRYRIAGVYSFGKGLIDRGWIMGSETSYSTLTRIAFGDIVLSKLNGWEGAIAVVDEKMDGSYVSPEYPVFVPRTGALRSEYFAGMAASPAFWDALDTSTRGSMVRRRRINPSDFLATQVWIPPIDFQDKVIRSLASVSEIKKARQVVVSRIAACVPSALNAAFGSVN